MAVQGLGLEVTIIFVTQPAVTTYKALCSKVILAFRSRSMILTRIEYTIEPITIIFGDVGSSYVIVELLAILANNEINPTAGERRFLYAVNSR